MKKLTLTIAIILGITMTTFAEGGLGLFERNYNAANGKSGYLYFSQRDGVFDANETPTPLMPLHGTEDNQPAPVGSGIAVLMGLGAAYMVAKKRREE